MKEREYLKELGKKITDSSVRKEIVNEYEAHIEDCKAALMESGMTEVEAEEEAVARWAIRRKQVKQWIRSIIKCLIPICSVDAGHWMYTELYVCVFLILSQEIRTHFFMVVE